MEAFLLYLLKSAGLVISFYMAYLLLLRKETYFQSNRWFLMSGLLLSVFLPFFTYTRTVWIERPKVTMEQLLAMAQSTSSNSIEPSSSSWDWSQVVIAGYWIITALFITRIFIQLRSVYILIKNRPKQTYQQLTLVENDTTVAPFSFFHFIVMNSSLYNDEERESIVLHEQVHSQQHHSIDVLLAHLYCCLFWFNPVAWMYKKVVVQNLEYIADREAIAHCSNPINYQKTLLKVAVHQQPLTIINPFNQSLIKKRIVMLNTHPSYLRKAWKLAIALPIVTAFILLFQVKTVAQTRPTKTQTNTTKSETTALSVIMDYTDSDASWYALKDAFKSEGFTIKVSHLKRNADQKLIEITAQIRSKEGAVQKFELKQNNPINAIEFYIQKSNASSWDFGIRQTQKALSKEVTAADIQVDSEETTISSETESSDTWSINEYTNNGKPYLVIIDGIQQDPANPLKIDGKLEIEKVVKIEDPAKLEAYGPAGKNGVILMTTKITSKKDTSITEVMEKKPLIIIDGKESTREVMMALDPETIDQVEVFKDEKSIKLYGDKGKNGVISITTNKNGKTTPSTIVITNDNGDDIVFMKNFSAMKVPGSPSVTITETSPALIIDGVQQVNPRKSLQNLEPKSIATIRVYDQSGALAKGTPITKIVITTK